MRDFQIGGETYCAKNPKAAWYLNQAMELSDRQEGQIDSQIVHLVALAMIHNDVVVKMGHEITTRPKLGSVIERSRVPGWSSYRVGEGVFGFDPNSHEADEAELAMLRIYDLLHRQELEAARDLLSNAIALGIIIPMIDDCEDEG
ncbi:MAG: hypothetical protein ABIK28_02515 [Planctomycetota bacterium]